MKNFVRIPWSSNSWKEFWSNPWRISQEFRGHLSLEEFNSCLNLSKYWKNSVVIYFSDRNIGRIQRSSNFLIRILVEPIPEFWWNYWRISEEFRGHLTPEEFHSHLNCCHQNSDRNPWKFSHEFCGHLILDKNSDQNPRWILQEFCGHLIFEEFNSQSELLDINVYIVHI